MNTDELVAETANMQSEDVRQEYLLLRLEGMTREEAVTRSGAADPLASRNKQRGPLVNGQRPMVSDYRGFTDLTSITTDLRTDIERDNEWEAYDRAVEVVADILDRIPPAQAEAIRTLYGFGTGTHLSWPDAAKAAGVTTPTISHRISSARRNMQKIVDSQAA
jgi:DNA-directed RNA polymerase specialized sigma24 family protein